MGIAKFLVDDKAVSQDAQPAPSEKLLDKSADGRMATDAARLKRQNLLRGKRKNRLDTNRPSHGKTYPGFARLPYGFLGDSSVSAKVLSCLSIKR